MTTIRLRQDWRLGDVLGSGGFGRVYSAVAEDGTVGVVKLIPKAPGANRELLFEDLAGVPNIVPILEVGEIDEAYALAMPRASGSLRDVMRPGTAWSTDDAIAVLRDVAETVAALEGKVVHRDMKPENILLLQDRWCLADFGIARFAEASTSPDTQKYAISAPYAAPERWRGERATSATDVYAVGVVAYELLSGELPFPGPSFADFREQHLTVQPPPVEGIPHPLSALINECLLKAPGARPSPDNLCRRLLNAGTPSSEAVERLQEANAAAARRASQAMAEAERARLRKEGRRDLYDAAQVSFSRLRDTLRKAIVEQAPQAGSDSPFELNNARLLLEGPEPVAEAEFDATGYEPGFEVVAYAQVLVMTGNERYPGRAHSIWYSDAQTEGDFRWFENAWMCHAYLAERFEMEPTALRPSRGTLVALSPATGALQLAWPFTPIDQGDEAEFIERWVGWFADAALGRLERPRRMPERETHGSYREARLRERR